MESSINSFFDKSFVPLIYRLPLSSKDFSSLSTLKLSVRDTPDTDNWKHNGFDEDYYKALYKTSIGGEYYTIVNLLDIYVNISEWQHSKYEKTVLKYPYFVADRPVIVFLKSIFYFYLGVLPITNVCNVVHTLEENETTYFSNIIIDSVNQLDPFAEHLKQPVMILN